MVTKKPQKFVFITNFNIVDCLTPDHLMNNFPRSPDIKTKW